MQENIHADKRRFFRIGYVALVSLIVVGFGIILHQWQRQSDLDDYYYEKLKQCHFVIIHPCKKMISESMRDTFAADWIQIQEQMVQEGYSRAEVKKLDDKAFGDTRKEIDSMRPGFWDEMEAKVVR